MKDNWLWQPGAGAVLDPLPPGVVSLLDILALRPHSIPPSLAHARELAADRDLPLMKAGPAKLREVEALGFALPAASRMRRRVGISRITWNHVIDKESRKIKELEHVGLEKVEQLF